MGHPRWWRQQPKTWATRSVFCDRVGTLLTPVKSHPLPCRERPDKGGATGSHGPLVMPVCCTGSHTIIPMNSISTISWRVKIGFVVAGYAGVLGVAAMMIVRRYLAGLRDPDMFSSGMAAGGDWMLELFLVALFLLPTFFLVLLIRNSEAAYTRFAQVLLGFGLTAPASMGLMLIPAVGQSNSLLGSFCLYRIFSFPMTAVGLAGSCVLAKFKRPRRLILYSTLIEILSFVLLLGLMGSAH